MRRLRLPRFEYTLRELSTGTCFFAYADRNNSTYASHFAQYVIEHLKSYGISTATIIWQTDNGSEFIGNVRKKINRPSAFEKELKANDIEHGRIPPSVMSLTHLYTVIARDEVPKQSQKRDSSLRSE